MNRYVLQLLALITTFSIHLATFAQDENTSMQSITVELGDYTFKPNKIEISVNQPVELTFVNTDSFTPHDFVLQQLDAGIDININVKGGKTETVTFTPTKTGEYMFHCSKKLLFFKSHQDRGMHGTLVVK